MDILFILLISWGAGILVSLFSAIVTVEYTTVIVEKSKWIPVPLSLIIKSVLWPLKILAHLVKAIVFYIIKHVGQIKAQLKSDVAAFDSTLNKVIKAGEKEAAAVAKEVKEGLALGGELLTNNSQKQSTPATATIPTTSTTDKPAALPPAAPVATGATK